MLPVRAHHVFVLCGGHGVRPLFDLPLIGAEPLVFGGQPVPYRRTVGDALFQFVAARRFVLDQPCGELLFFVRFDLLVQPLGRRAQVGVVVAPFEEVVQLRVDAVRGGEGDLACGDEHRPLEGRFIDAEDRFADGVGKLGAGHAVAVHGERVFGLARLVEGAFDLIRLSAVEEHDVPAEHAAAEGAVVRAVIEFCPCERGVHAVEHGLEKGGEGGLAVAVLFAYARQPVAEGEAFAADLAEIFNVTGEQFHRSNSSPRSARSPQRRICCFSSSVQSPAAYTARTNSPLSETSFSYAAMSSALRVRSLTLM